jgi:hypothetical protein
VPKKLLGSTRPRLYTPELRKLDRRTSLGYEAADFAEQIIGVPLIPWQRWAAIHAMELLPDGSFRFRKVLIIVGRQNGKSHLKRTVSLWRMYMEPKTQVYGVAQEVKLARKQWNFCQEAIHDSPQLEAEWGDVRNVNGDEYFWLSNSSLYAIGAASRKSGRGSSNDEVNIDELREQRNWQAWAALSKTINARPNPQIWCMSNAGDDESVVLNQLQDAGHAGRDEALGVFEWSAPDGCELDDWNAIRQANPGLGYILSEAGLRSDLASDPPEISRTEILCQRVHNLNSAIDLERWDSCADAMGTLDAHRGRIAACFDVAPDGQHATLAVAARLDGGRVRAEITAAWANTDQARKELPALLAKIRPAAFGWYPAGPAAGMATTLRPLALRYNKRPGKREPGAPPEDGTITGARASEVCQELADLVKALRIVHPADPLLDAHIRGASKLLTGDGWRFTRKGEGHVDAAYAAAGAVSLALTIPEPRRGGIRGFAA